MFGKEANSKFGEGYNVKKVIAALETSWEHWTACNCGERVHDGPCSIDTKALAVVMNGGVREARCEECHALLNPDNDPFIEEMRCGNCREDRRPEP